MALKSQSLELTATGNKNHSGCFVSKIAYGLLGEGLLQRTGQIIVANSAYRVYSSPKVKGGEDEQTSRLRDVPLGSIPPSVVAA